MSILCLPPNVDNDPLICVVVCGKMETLSDWNTHLCGSRYWPPDYGSGLLQNLWQNYIA